LVYVGEKIVWKSSKYLNKLSDSRQWKGQYLWKIF